MHCVICDGTDEARHIFREMMFGTREEFAYRECLNCGCLQIAEIPDNLDDYYPGNYYSFVQRPWSLWLYRAYWKAPRLAQLLRPAGPTFQSVLDANPKPGARILDVGCGGGKMVTILRDIGFDAHGIDAFAKTETAYVHRKYLQESTEKDWDLIMFLHSLEHMSDHVGALRAARERLAPDGICLVGIPLANWAWRHYGKDWVQLDPPRHLIIHTLQSFRLAAEAAGFRIARIIFNSGPFQFYGSEMYQRNTPLTEERAEIERLGKVKMRALKARSIELNQQQLGDQAFFHLIP